jgi:hypothetical protein
VAVRRVAALLLALFALACTRDHVQRGTNLYGKGRYIEAAEVFERTENRLPHLEDTSRARYGLYRGLTLLVLGDLAGAKRWFDYAHQVETEHPGSLGRERITLLERGTSELNSRINQPPSAVAEGEARTRDAGDHMPVKGQVEPPRPE